jgi:putative transposase
MSRQARLDTAGALHHVMVRGIEGTDIFRTDQDRTDFLARLAKQCESEALRVYAWALLPNHLHLLLRTGNRPISESMRRILTGYAVRFNHIHRRQGHLFQNRYKSILCEEQPYLLELTRYIHLNPLRAGIVRTLKGLGGYPWSGHSAMVGKVKRSWQDTGEVLGYFAKRRELAIERYIAYLEEGIPLGNRAEFRGGGLLRSVGGWSEVVSMRRRGIGIKSDARSRGGGGFVERVIGELEAKERETLRLRQKVPDLRRLLREVAGKNDLSEEEVKSLRRRRKAVKATKLFCHLAVRKWGYTGASVARFLGLTTSLVNRYAALEEVLE